MQKFFENLCEVEKLEVEKPNSDPPANDEKTPDEVIEELKEEDFFDEF